MQAGTVPIDALDLSRLAELIARLSRPQQRVVAAVAEGFRTGWLDPARWERGWGACDLKKFAHYQDHVIPEGDQVGRHGNARTSLADEGVLAEMMTWLVRLERSAADPQVRGRSALS